MNKNLSQTKQTGHTATRPVHTGKLSRRIPPRGVRRGLRRILWAKGRGKDLVSRIAFVCFGCKAVVNSQNAITQLTCK